MTGQIRTYGLGHPQTEFTLKLYGANTPDYKALWAAPALALSSAAEAETGYVQLELSRLSPQGDEY